MPEPRIPPLPESEWTDEQREILERIFQVGGHARNIFTTAVRHPRILRRWSAFGGVLLTRNLLPGEDRELLVLRTARNCQADYPWGQHELAVRRRGVTPEQLTDIAGDGTALTTHQQLLIRAADEMHATWNVSDETWTALAETYSEAQLIELIFVVGQYHLVSLLVKTLAIEREADLPSLPSPPAQR